MERDKGFFCCHWCNRKYKTLEKFTKHVKAEHPFSTLDRNNKKLSLKNKLYLLKNLETYIHILQGEDDEAFIKATLKIGATPEGHREFQRKIMESQILNKLSVSNLELLFEQFELFLNLGRPYDGTNFCPSLIIDLVWHSAMLGRKKYIQLCEKFIGKPLSHCVSENEGRVEERFAYFEAQFLHHHGKAYLKTNELVVGGENGIAMMRERLEEFKLQKTQAKQNAILKREEECRFREIKWKIYEEASQKQIEIQITNGTYRPAESEACSC